MLEYDFNVLDNDFITIWSKYFLTNDSSIVKDYIEALAELGQINAVQSWYLISQGEENKNINAIVRSYKGGNFNEYFALANYCIDEYEINRKINYIQDDLLLNENFSGKEFRQALIEEIKYYKYLNKAIQSAKNITISSMNNFTAERLAEMLYASSSVWPIKGECKKIKKLAFKVAKEARKKLMIEYKKLPDADLDTYIFCQKYPQLAYALAKNYMSFTKEEKDKVFGISIMEELSKRVLSKTLQDHIKILEEKKLFSIDKDIQKEDRIERDPYVKLIQRMLHQNEMEETEVKQEESIELDQSVKSREVEIGFIDALCEKRDKESSMEPEQLSIFDIND